MTTITEIIHDDILKDCFLTDTIDTAFVALSSLQQTLEDPELRQVLENPNKQLAEKTQFIRKLIAKLPSEGIQEALTKLFEERGLDFFLKNDFPDFLAATSKALENIETVKIQVALHFKEADLRKMVEQFSLQTGKTVAFQVTVDSSLLGGAIIQFGNYIHDYSLRSKLNQFKSKWKKAVVD